MDLIQYKTEVKGFYGGWLSFFIVILSTIIQFSIVILWQYSLEVNCINEYIVGNSCSDYITVFLEMLLYMTLFKILSFLWYLLLINYMNFNVLKSTILLYSILFFETIDYLMIFLDINRNFLLDFDLRYIIMFVMYIYSLFWFINLINSYFQYKEWLLVFLGILFVIPIVFYNLFQNIVLGWFQYVLKVIELV